MADFTLYLSVFQLRHFMVSWGFVNHISMWQVFQLSPSRLFMQHGCSHVHRSMAALCEDHPLRQEAKDTKVMITGTL